MEPWNFEGIRNWMGGGRKWKKMHSVVRKIDTLTHISMTQVDPNIIVIWVSNLETHMSMTQIDPHAIVIWVSNLEWLIMWRNHPKLLGPGALIFVAKQLWPKLVLTGSSSSEASIKATLFQDQQTTLTRRWAQRLQHRTFHTSQSDCSGKEIYYKTSSE